MAAPTITHTNVADDPLSSPDYDPITHLNQIFSHPSTLSRVSPALQTLQNHESHLTAQITHLTSQQRLSHSSCLTSLQTSRAELSLLLTRIDALRTKALNTQSNITSMTAEIKSLDTTKRNLVRSMTALKRLQMLSTAFAQLRGVVKGRQYGEAARLLGAVVQLEEHFRGFRSVDQVAALSKEVGVVKGEVEEQVREDFELAWSRDEVVLKQNVLREGCEVIEVLGPEARGRLVNWYVNAELRGYRGIFRGEGEAGGLDNVDRRYAWWRKMVKGWEEVWSAIFPANWRVGERLAESFAEGTREDYKGVLARMTRAGQGVDVNLLLNALQQTLEFEQGLERKFAGRDGSRTSIDTTVSADGQGVLGGQLISSVFEPYLGLWVDAQERELASLLPQYRARPAKPPEEEFSSQMVVTSASELFNFYRLSLQQCAKLSTGPPLLDLSKVFAKFLDMYAQQVLLFYLSERPTAGTPSRVPSLEDVILVLNTADYCYNTTQSLSDKIHSRIDEPLKDSIDLSSQADAFMGIASASVRALVRIVEVALDPSWREMRNIGWSRIETAADKSSFISPLQQAIKSKSASILDLIHKPQYSRAFADNLVELLASTYLSQILQCRPISEAGAEQMLLDLHEIKSTLSTLLPGNPPPALFLKRVTTSFSRIEPLLKTLQVRPHPPEALVQAYLIHIADLSEPNFRKVLDLKGLTRRQENNQLVELYQMHKFSPRYKDSLTEKSPLLTPLILGSTTGGGGSGTTGAAAAVSVASVGGAAALSNLSALGNSAAASLSTANLPANMKFDASGLGNAIMDRFSSTPVLGTPGLAQSPPTGSGSGIANPMEGAAADGLQQQQGKLNENLKNIGKFFKRDMGGFGMGRFGGGGGGGQGDSKATSPAPPEDRR